MLRKIFGSVVGAAEIFVIAAGIAQALFGAAFFIAAAVVLGLPGSVFEVVCYAAALFLIAGGIASVWYVIWQVISGVVVATTLDASGKIQQLLKIAWSYWRRKKPQA